MIYTDQNGLLNIEYGHGSVVGHFGIWDDKYPAYSLTTNDPKEIGTKCEQTGFKNDVEFGALLRFVFKKKESLDILLKDLTYIKENWEKFKT